MTRTLAPTQAAPPLLSRVAVARAGSLRACPDQLAALWSQERTRVLRIDKGLVPLRSATKELSFLPPGPSFPAPGEEGCYFLGREGEGPACFAVAGPFAPATDEAVMSLRAIAGVLPPADCGLVTHAAALNAWHARSRFCPVCGGRTVIGEGGHQRHCTACAACHFPRTDPAVIVLVLDARGRALVARNAAWPSGRFSTIAGFVEAGEAPEAAVAREVAEEIGLTVGDIRYQGAQPWPFPGSLMLAFTARTRGTAVTLDGAELAEARWFSRGALRTAVANGEVRVPSTVSIARWQIELWLGEPLAHNEDW